MPVPFDLATGIRPQAWQSMLAMSKPAGLNTARRSRPNALVLLGDVERAKALPWNDADLTGDLSDPSSHSAGQTCGAEWAEVVRRGSDRQPL